FLTVFEGGELGIAGFFSSWLLWVSVGALLGRSRLRVLQFASRHFDLFPLLYLPAYVLQAWLIARARDLVGVPAYELFPLAKMLGISFAVNAPLSFCTGLFFALGCEWMSGHKKTPVSSVYICEAIGSFFGGLAVTALLAVGVPGESVALWAALLLSASVGVYRLLARSYVIALVPVSILLGLKLLAVDSTWERSTRIHRWQQLLPTETYQGSFATPQAEYLYGEYEGQFTVAAWETVNENIPGTEHASEVVAVHLAQHPAARRFAVVGPGSFSVCKRLLELPGTDSVTWLDTDPDYPRALLSVLPPHLAPGRKRLVIPGIDAREWFARNGKTYDVIMLNLPDATTLALNRYFSREFFDLLKTRLAESGIVSVRVTGGENYYGDELVNMGATVFHTLGSAFEDLVVKPGEETWLMASDADTLSMSPALLRDRFRGVEGAESIYPPDGLPALYLPDRIEFQLAQYRKAIDNAPGRLLLNTGRHPTSLLHSLLFGARKAGAGVGFSGGVRLLAVAGRWILPLAMALYVLLRAIYLLKGRSPHGDGTGSDTRTYDDCFLVVTTGAVGMGFSILLMFMYQLLFGTIFLHVGLISALFMLGIAAGSLVCARLVARNLARAGQILAWGTLLHMVLIGIVSFAIRHDVSRGGFAALFVVSGMLSGIYIPAVASRLRAAGTADRTAGGLIELSDHLGGAVGGLLIGIVMLPLFGTAYAMAVTAAALGLNVLLLVPSVQGKRGHGSRVRIDRGSRTAGYVLFGIAAFALATSVLLHRELESGGNRFAAAARSMAGSREQTAQTHVLSDGRRLEYFEIERDDLENKDCLFSTKHLSGDIHGYGGPIVMAVMLTPDGAMLDFRVIRSTETPSYLDMLGNWMNALKGKTLSGEDGIDKIEAVTGATVTCDAVVRTLQRAGNRFSRDVLGIDTGETDGAETGSLDPTAAFLVIGLVAALLLRIKPSGRARPWILLAVTLVFGVLLNTQYSLSHVFSLLRLQVPAWPPAWILTLLVPAVVLVFGNVYCGYLCPFGALQELVGMFRPRLLDVDPDKNTWRYGRAVKYVLLGLIVVWYASALDHGIASYDPLTSIFAPERSGWVLLAGGGALALSFFYRRFWCRNLCPAGAFLALLNGLRPLRRYLPRVAPSRCDLGVTRSGELDCICCDHCRISGHEPSVAPGRSQRVRNGVFLAVLAVSAVLLARQMGSLHKTRRRAWMVTAGTEIQGVGARAADVQKLTRLIEQGRLSNREAQHYKPLPPSTPNDP
ncbi:MAG: 4Fe-4S binding protein, partial [Lentisphaerae bacterium]|nr:4Fe-4S binding protein [Lentisphaerota bacterium]